MRFHLTLLVSLFVALSAQAQDFELKSSVEIYQDVQELQRGVRVLYLAAHPDDENTRLISWLENDQHIRTAYLSLTRGQGGQNLIGDEKGDALGVLRTYELLEARKVDGGEQYFTRAVDFGYSKSAEESFEKWGKEEVLHDVVYVIRKFRPHIIITRFPPTRRAGHGHHEASALLAEEAFDLAIDPNIYPEQVAELGVWQPEALYWNASSWWDKSLEELDEAGLIEKKMHRVNIGVYNDLIGYGMNEIASMARSKHRCQAFGTTRARGLQNEYLQFVKGAWSEQGIDGVAGIWARSVDHQNALGQLISEWDFTSNQKNLESLNRLVGPKLAQRSMWAEERDMHWIQKQIQELKLDLSGIRVEVYADQDQKLVDRDFEVNIEVYNSSSIAREIRFDNPKIDTTFSIEPGVRVQWVKSLKGSNAVSNPLWLQHEKDGVLYHLSDKKDIGKPFAPDQQIGYTVKIDGMDVSSTTTLHRRWRDRSIGEIIQPMIMTNPVTINPNTNSLIVGIGSSKMISVRIDAHEDITEATFSAKADGWDIYHDSFPFSLKKGQSKNLDVKLTPSTEATTVDLALSIQVGKQSFGMAQDIIEHEHVPELALHTASTVKLIPLGLEMDSKKRILYIEGSGDEIDESLTSLGYRVETKNINGMSALDLGKYDAVITGIRAFNRNDDAAANIELLHDYVKNGGNMIVMYNTTYDLKVEQIGPFPIKLSRNRVTEEDAAVELLASDSKVFLMPNKLEESDWENWVQERGLYFAGEWSDDYTPLIGWHDTGEENVNGGLLVAHHGQGSFFYSGVSFFRQLPAGVSGAYRLLVNMIEYQQ